MAADPPVIVTEYSPQFIRSVLDGAGEPPAVS